MRLLQLTDFYDKASPEFLVIEKIRHIQKHTEKFLHVTTEMVDAPEEASRMMALINRLMSGPPAELKKVEKKTETVVERTGSCIFFDNDENSHTIVLESPQEVAKLLADGSKTTEVKG